MFDTSILLTIYSSFIFNKLMYFSFISKINLFVNPSLETIYLRPSKNYEMISSSTVKELNKYNQDVSSLVPKEVYKIIKGE